jgi:hypothetical protein
MSWLSIDDVIDMVTLDHKREGKLKLLPPAEAKQVSVERE